MAAKFEIVCKKNNISYGDVRKAMVEGARTKEDLIDKAGVCGECPECIERIPYMTSMLCGCKEVPMQKVIDAVQSKEASTLEDVMEMTGAGTGENCGRCQGLIKNIFELGY